MKIPIRDPNDKRKADRVKVDLNIEVLFPNGKKMKGKLRDISIGGARVQVSGEEKISSRDQVEVHIDLPQKRRIVLKGNVVWNTTSGRDTIIGITNLELSEKDKEWFLEFLSESILNFLFSLS